MKKFWIRLVVTVAILAAIATQVDFSRLELASPARVAVGTTVATVLITLNQGISAVRWRVILGEDSPRWGYLTRLNLIGIFFSTFLPTSVGGDAVRAWALAREVPKPGTALSSVVLDRGMGFAALVGYLGAGALMSRQMLVDLAGRLELQVPGWVWFVAGLAIVPLGVWLVRATRLGRWLREALQHLNRFRKSGRTVVAATLLSFLVQGVYIAVWMTLAFAAGFALPWETFLVTVPVVSLGAMIPVTLSGLGIREGLWILLLGRFELTAATVTAFSLLYFLAFAVTGGIGGLIYVVQGTTTDRTQENSE